MFWLMKRIVAILLVVTAYPASLDAREARSDHVPNAGRFDCGLCHVDSAGEGPRNAFGQQIEEMGLSGEGPIGTQEVVWAQIYDGDPDGDGFTNGEELGDPDGEWRIGDGDPSVRFPSLPGDPDSVPCGTNAVHPGEECDGTDLDGQSCETLGFASGTLACNVDCTFDTSTCVPFTGNEEMGTTPGPDSGVPPVTSDMGGVTPGPDPRDDDPLDPDSEPSGDAGSAAADDPPALGHRGCSGDLVVDYPGDAGDAAIFLFFAGWLLRRARLNRME